MTEAMFKDEWSVKPFILTFKNGLKGWCKAESWTVDALKER